MLACGDSRRSAALALTLVTDTTADLPPALARELGITVARASVAFEARRYMDGELPAEAFYQRMRETGETPLPSGVPEKEFMQAFEAGLEKGEVVCLVMPFDVIPTFTTASAAMLGLEERGKAVKITNPGVASAGLCSLLVSLAGGVGRGWDRERLLAALDRLEPECDCLFVPGDVRWLRQAGRLGLIEEKLGPIEDRFPIVRVGTRVSAAGLGESREAAVERAIELAGLRAGAGREVVVTIDHADAPEEARQAAAMAQSHHRVARLVMTHLSPTIGSQLGPGAIGIGVAPVAEKEG